MHHQDWLIPRSVISAGNSTVATLAGAATFTGVGQFTDHADVLVTCKSDVAGTLYIDLSIDGGSNYDTSLAFVVDAGGGEFHTVVKGPRTCRVRYINGASAQGYFRLMTAFGTFRQPNSAMNSAASQDADAAIVKALDGYLLVKQDLFAGYSMDTKFGRNADVDAAEDIWASGGDYTGFPTGSAETIDVVSTSTSDAAAGTGVRTVRLYGLDANFDAQTEDVTLNGTTAVTTVATWKRMNRIKALTVGSAGLAVGVITAAHTTTTANVFGTIQIGQAQTKIACYTVPAGYTMYLKRFAAYGARSTGTGLADISFQVRDYSASDDTPFRVVRDYTIGNGVAVNTTYIGGLVIDEKSDVKVRADSVSAANLDIAAEFEYVLVKNGG